MSRDILQDEAKQPMAARKNCPTYDYILIDDPATEIEGYTAFGDSYAAGLGTGTTSTDSCRVGENNYGKLLHKSWNNDKIPFESKVCSGDTLIGLNRQIDGWNVKHQNESNVGTVSIGGNDVGFSDLVWYCIITPNTARWGSTNRANCVDAEKKARSLMQDKSGNGLQAKLKAAYIRIMQRSYRSVSNHSIQRVASIYSHPGRTSNFT